jgi:hypothetical protein
LRDVRRRPVDDMTTEERELCIRAIVADVYRYRALSAPRAEQVHVWTPPEHGYTDPTVGRCSDPGVESLEVVHHDWDGVACPVCKLAPL